MTSTPTAASFAHAFVLGHAVEPLAFIQHTVSRTWRLTTDTGTYLAKELWAGDDPHWTGQLADRMGFEQEALEAEIRPARSPRAEHRPPRPLGADTARRSGDRGYTPVAHRYM